MKSPFQKFAVLILLGLTLYAFPQFLFAQGMVIPDGSAIMVNTGTLCSNNDITVSGTLQSTTGWVRMRGDWIINPTGTYVPGTGVLDFKGGGTQTLDSQGTGNGRSFYTLSHTGTGILNVSNNDLNIDGTFSNTAGTVNANGQNITVEGNWRNTATFNGGTATVVFDGTNQMISGSTTFNNFMKAVLIADTLVFDNTGTQTITGTLQMHGTLGQLLTITTDNDTGLVAQQWGIALAPMGFQNIHSVNVRMSDASAGLTLRAGVNSVDLGVNTNWVFGGASLTWDGDSDTDWNDPTNWDLGFAPSAIDSVVIPAAPANQPILNLNASITQVEVQSGATVTTSGFNWAISGTLNNDGSVYVQGNETISIGTHLTDSGTFVYTGDNTGSTYTLPDYGSIDYFNLVINDVNGSPNTMETNGTLTVNGSLSVTAATLNTSTNTNFLDINGSLVIDGGTLITTTGSIDLEGNLSLSAGTFTAPSGTFSIGGNFNHSTGGTFNHSSGAVVFDGTNQGITGDVATTFAQLIKETSVPDTFTFSTSSAQSITGTLRLMGTAGNILSIVSDSTGVQAFIGLQSGGIQDLEYLDVRDNNATTGTGVLLVPRNSTEAFANNTNWAFGGGTFTWEGDVDSNWDTAGNWDLGLVPSTADTASVPMVATVYPTLVSNISINGLTIGTGGVTVVSDGFDVVVAGTLSNQGTLQLQGDETYTFGTVDADSGTVLFTGDGDGSADTYVITDFGTTDFFNLIINDSNATMDLFQIGGTLAVAGTLNITSSSLDISTMTGTLVTTGSIIVDGGSLIATNGNIDANGNVTITSGTLLAPVAGGNFTIADDWTVSGSGTFVHNSGNVEFDDASKTTTFSGNSRFESISSTAGGKNFIFPASSNQTIEGTMFFNGTSGSEIILRSDSPGTNFILTFPGMAQTSQFVDVDYSTAATNVMNCFSCVENTSGSTVNWIFGVLAITAPSDGVTHDTSPTIIGVAGAGSTVDIRDGANTLLGTTTSDADGNFRLELAGPLAVGPISLRPYIGAFGGAAVSTTVSAAPTTAEQPTITSHVNGERVLDKTPTFEGLGNPGSSIEILANDLNGNMTLTVVATGSVALDGSYSVTTTTPLKKGTNYISVTVGGVASDLLTIGLTDPYGIVFNSITNEPIENASVLIVSEATGLALTPGVEIAATDVNPVVTGTNGAYAFFTINDDFRLEVSADSYDFPSVITTFPVGRAITTGSKGETFTVNGTILEIDLPLDPSANLLRIEKNANKSEVRIGDVVTYKIDIESIGSITLSDVLIRDLIPPGFKYIKDRVTLDGIPIAEPTGNRPVFFSVGAFDPGEKKILRYQLVVGSGVTQGDYQNVAVATHTSGLIFSNTATESVTVVLDPLFDLGTTIGKVFYDRNENGVQDPPYYDRERDQMISEDPVPNVRIAMEDGTVITTDRLGKYSVPALVPGRHLFRVDERTLPEGAYLTTDKVAIVDVTPGLLLKVNFGINIAADELRTIDQVFFAEQVKVTLDQAKPTPRLHIAMFEDKAGIANDVFLEKIEFRIFTNYAAFVKRWELEFVDVATGKIIKRIEGDQLNIYDPIFWDGRDDQGQHIDPKRELQYRLFLEDVEGKFDETQKRVLNFQILEAQTDVLQYQDGLKKKREVYQQWVLDQQKKNSLNVQNILIDGETVIIDRLNTKLQSVQIMKNGRLVAQVPLIERSGLTAQEIINRKQILDIGAQQQLEVILPKGDYRLVVQEAGDLANVDDAVRVVEGYGEIKEARPTTSRTYTQPLKVGEDQLFFVAMGDARIGYTSTRGNVEPVSQEERYKGGFYDEGKFAYYLQGKILGKYLVESSFDNERERKELFRTLDEEEYYPVYGDESSIDYAATDTQGNLYALIEWDKSKVKWGNYSVNFGDTEFARFSRSLYGGVVDFETLSTTKYGDSRSKLVVFRARAQQKSAHVEYLATGGSLYFTKHKRVLEGSAKIQVEVRDNVTGLVISSKDVVEGADYEFDYKSGRIIFWQPIPLLVESFSIIDDDILEGNLVYVVMDYEYEVKDKVDEATTGVRARQAIGDNILVGTTYVNESLTEEDYQLRAADVTLKFGKDAQIVAEIAESLAESQPNFVSTDGGLSFTELSIRGDSKGKALGLKGNATLFNRVGTSAYYKWVDHDFSTSATTAQQGKELYGFKLEYEINEKGKFTLTRDTQRILDDGNLQTQLQVGTNKKTTTIAQYIQEVRKLRVTAEYRRTEDERANTAVDVVALRADYAFSDRLIFSLEHQQTLQQKNYKTTIGVQAKPTEKLTINVQEVISDDGTATTVGVVADLHQRISLTGQYALTEDKFGDTGSTWSMGAQSTVGEKIKLYTSLGLSSENGFTRNVRLGDLPKLEKAIKRDIYGQTIGAEAGLGYDGAATGSATLDYGGTKQINEATSVSLGGQLGLNAQGLNASTISFGGTTDVDGSSVSTNLAVTSAGDLQTAAVSIGGSKQVDEQTEVTNKFTFSELETGLPKTAFTFGTKKQLSEDIEFISSRTFSAEEEGQSTDSTYSLSRVKDGKKLTGSLARRYVEGEAQVSRSNIFGLTGEIDDRWAFRGTYERALVENLDTTKTQRDVVSLALGYVKKDPETRAEMLKSSTKLEVRMDEGVTDLRQLVFTSSTEGKLTQDLSVFSKIEYTETRNRQLDKLEEQHKEFEFGIAYRPIYQDNLNVIARATYLENESPSSQEDFALIEAERAYVFALEGIYDLTNRWRFTEKAALRIAEEKVEGFPFTETHTWLMVHRLDYKINQEWAVGGEYRMLTQREAQDRKQGAMIEVTRRVGDYAQMGVGYDFTDFSDDLTDLDYSTSGPFIRVTGKFYDQTPEERKRNREKYLVERIERWAWQMVEDELAREDSPILRELNDYFIMANLAARKGDWKESQRIYKDIIAAGKMMHEEAKDYIRQQIAREQHWKEMKDLADQYYKNGQYIKAKEILEKILGEATSR